jgi:hypothetical protein
LAGVGVGLVMMGGRERFEGRVWPADWMGVGVEMVGGLLGMIVEPSESDIETESLSKS